MSEIRAAVGVEAKTMRMKAIRILLGVTVVGCFAAACPAQAAKKPAATTHSKAATKKKTAMPAVNWSSVSAAAAPLTLEKASLQSDQIAAIESMLMDRTENDGWGCEDDVPPGDWLKDLTYWQLPLLPNLPTILVEAGNTCGRSSKDSPNAAMWIVVFHGRYPELLATPQESLNGALYSVQSARTHSLPDVVVTWRVSDTESDLTYLQFDGQVYTATAGAKRIEGSGPSRIEPMKMPAE